MTAIAIEVTCLQRTGGKPRHDLPQFLEIEEKEIKVTPKFKVGDIVEWTNGNGVPMGKRTINGLDVALWNEPHYFITPIDTPWFPIAEKNLSLAGGNK